jgi:cysteinyl-tRNA synthetase
MARDLLGGEFDIHGGGLDLQFPHHENEIAQSACVGDSLARVWVHNEMLQVEGRKMSKSLGNFFTVRDLLDEGVPGEVIRLVLLGSHYGKPMDWTARKVEEAESVLRRWRVLTEGVARSRSDDPVVDGTLRDDLNVPGVIARLHQLGLGGVVTDLLASANLLGLLTDKLAGWTEPSLANGVALAFIRSMRRRLMRVRTEAVRSKDFSRVDRLKTDLVAVGVEVRMTKDDIELVPTPNYDDAGLKRLHRRTEDA